MQGLKHRYPPFSFVIIKSDICSMLQLPDMWEQNKEKQKQKLNQQKVHEAL